jgi:hypothetical protein
VINLVLTCDVCSDVRSIPIDHRNINVGELVTNYGWEMGEHPHGKYWRELAYCPRCVRKRLNQSQTAEVTP